MWSIGFLPSLTLRVPHREHSGRLVLKLAMGTKAEDGVGSSMNKAVRSGAA